MVMATPSPQQVGREFVRQYYTVLHEAPDVLHRFYSSGSTFVHGGVDRPDRPSEEPVIGQLEIDKKIKVLNFKDCHTKIRQVDSQLTIGSGVVVQVTGELSNNGEPMRRFMQTFVLAPQTPKKFYVHNDIFRYQDEVYQDNSDTESEDQQLTESNLISKTAVLNMNNYYQEQQDMNQQEEPTGQQSTSSMSSSLPILTSPTQATPVEQQHMESNDLSAQPVVEEKTNGHMNGHLDTETNSMTRMDEVMTNEEKTPVNVEETTPVVVAEETLVQQVESVHNIQKEELQNQTQETKINSWAKLVQSSGASVLDNNMLTGNNSQVYQTSQFLSNAPSTQKFGGSKEQNFNNTSNKDNKPAAPKNQMNGQSNKSSHNNKPRNSEGRRQGENQNQNQQEPKAPRENKESRVNADDDEKRFGRYPDGQQVFVGNLNQDLSETELRTYFSQYGKVMDMRINTNSKQQSGRRLPNYGFVVFEEKQAVENLLSASKSNSITYKNDKGIEYRLNVEEKRARQGRISSGFGGNKSNRNTRSSSNGSRNGGHAGGERSERPKKNTNYSQSSNNHEHTQGNNYERRGEGFGNNDRRKTDLHDGQIVDNNGRRNHANNPRRS